MARHCRKEEDAIDKKSTIELNAIIVIGKKERKIFTICQVSKMCDLQTSNNTLQLNIFRVKIFQYFNLE